MKITTLVASVGVGSLLMASSVLAKDITPRHGYVNDPASRAFLCSSMGGNLNKNCGAVQYEPQSIEGPKGFPAAGPKDGEIASAGLARFNELNQAGASRWHHVDINKGQERDFIWSLTAKHATTSWRFFITKNGWNPEKPLSRDQLNLTPFCERDDEGKIPAASVTIKCTVPADVKSGYHNILAVWDIADTGNAFYQVIDANIK